jgi:hypothetical protein
VLAFSVGGYVGSKPVRIYIETHVISEVSCTWDDLCQRLTNRTDARYNAGYCFYGNDDETGIYKRGFKFENFPEDWVDEFPKQHYVDINFTELEQRQPHDIRFVQDNDSETNHSDTFTFYEDFENLETGKVR